jgi:hypothetical protein
MLCTPKMDRRVTRERCRALSEKYSSKAARTGDPALKDGYQLLAESYAILEESHENVEKIRRLKDSPIIPRSGWYPTSR